MSKYHPMPLGSVFPKRGPSFHHMNDEDDILTIYIGTVEGVSHILTFDTYVAFRKIEESYALKIVKEIAEFSTLEQHLFESTESEFKSWFVSQASVLADGMNIKSYTITFQNEIIEVLSEEAPTLTAVHYGDVVDGAC